MAAIPVLSSRMFTLDYANDLEGQLINSPYAAQKLEEQGIDIEGLANYLGQYKEALSDEEPMLDLKALWNCYKEGSKAIDDLKAAMTVTKNDKKEFTIDGQSENCRGYHVTLPKDALISFAKTTREFFLNDETLKQDVVRYLELAGGASGIYAADGDGESVDPEEQQKELWAQAEAVLDNLVEEMENTIGDVTMDVYVRKDGKMAGFSYETDATVEEENVRFYGDVSFGGGYNMLSNVNGALNIEDSDGQIITVSLDKTSAYEAGKSWSGQVIATLQGDEEKYQFILDGDYQIADGSYEVKLDLQSNGASQASLTANGAVSDLSKGESVHIDMDSLRLETTLLNGSSSYVEFAGSYYVNPLEDEIVQPDGTGEYQCRAYFWWDCRDEKGNKVKAGTYTAVVTAEDASGSKTLEKEVKLAEDGSSETETESESETERETETQQPSTEAPNPNTGKETEKKDPAGNHTESTEKKEVQSISLVSRSAFSGQEKNGAKIVIGVRESVRLNPVITPACLLYTSPSPRD